MTRILGLFGFTGGFLIISPSLRQTVLDACYGAAAFAEQHSPYSYVGAVILVFGGVTMTLMSGQNSR
ncbi:MAG: hypothetical protein C5B51_20395 [Terriglobia bacterium]|nr:MAG: hypothetical protein C5B51_20395 [Terriglobia bacterium]